MARLNPTLVLLVLLTACGQDNPAADNYGYGWHYDYESQDPDLTGLRIRGNESRISELETEYRTVRACFQSLGYLLNNDEPRPLIIIHTEEQVPYLDEARTGLYYPDTLTIVLGNSYFLAHLRHELSHHLLYVAGIPVETHHDLPLFYACDWPYWP